MTRSRPHAFLAFLILLFFAHVACKAQANPPGPTLEDALREARASVEVKGYLHIETVVLPGRAGAWMVHRGQLDGRESTRVTFVTPAAPPVVVEDTVAQVLRHEGGAPTIDIRGDGGQSVVVRTQTCGANCSADRTTLLELAQGRWRTSAGPSRPTTRRARAGDGVATFSFSLAHIRVVSCARVACGPSLEMAVDVDGFEVWDGQTLARDHRFLAATYVAHLHGQVLPSLARPDLVRESCPSEFMNAAAALFVYARVLNFPPDVVAGMDAYADSLMRGRSMRQCAKDFASDTPKEWPTIKAELAKLVVPVLARGMP